MPTSAPTTSARRKIAGVVLAAGRSMRMGEANKLLLEIDGEPMVRRVVRTALATRLDPVVAVLGHESDAVREALTGLDATFVQNPEYAAGMSTSIARGVAAVSDAVDAAMIILGDMPWITASDLSELIEAFDPERGCAICAPVVDGRRGNPILWSAAYFDELLALDGDVGGRDLLSVHAGDVCEVAVYGQGPLRDVDTPEALESSRSNES